jgi:hypothetical protein
MICPDRLSINKNVKERIFTMGNIQTVNASSSLYEKIKTSKPVEFVKDNKILAGAALGASGVILKQAADKSEIAAAIVKKGVVPILSLGVAATGVALVHDALTDNEKNKDISLLKGIAGGAMTLAGVEVAGQAYGVSPLTETAKLVANVIPKNVLIGAAASAPGLVATAWGVSDMKEKGVTLGNAAAVGLGSTQATFYAGSVALENASEVVQNVAGKGMGLVVSGSLGLGAYAMGKEALNNIKDENWTKAGLYGTGAAVFGLGGAHVLAKTLGAPGLEKVAQAAIKNPILTGSVVVLGVTAGAYALYNKDK